MKREQTDSSIRIFFQTFTRHLERIRDEGTDAGQAYRAQIMLGQLSQFEKAVREAGGYAVSGTPGAQTFLSLLEIDDFESYTAWLLNSQELVELDGLYYLNTQSRWTALKSDRPLPASLAVGNWVERGVLGALSEGSNAYVAYVFGQPRLVFCPAVPDGMDGKTLINALHFFSRLLPLYLAQPVHLEGDVEMPDGLIARDPVFLELLALIAKAAEKDVGILVEGESGTGKEVIADFIHRKSSRARKPFVAVNCAAIPPGLIESELFGHEKGSFTNAYQRKIGRVEEADGGTLFLDEIGEMELAMQAKLLRFLQLQEFHRVGGKQKITVDVRIVAATNRNLKDTVSKGEFREDLYYRLSVMPFKVPSLRERVDDIVPLTNFFVEKYAAAFGVRRPEIDPLVYRYLAAYDFPGNVRELENLIQNMLVVSQNETITTAHLPSHLQVLEPVAPLVKDRSGKVRVWNIRRRFKNRAPVDLGFFGKGGRQEIASLDRPWEGRTPKNNDELKLMKQQIQDYASELTLQLEHRFLKELLLRAEGSMPQASKMGDINRTLLYKMIDRTKHLGDPTQIETEPN